MYDYLIVGGGSAGCVLANRLSADPRHRVCLLEAGPDDSTPLVSMPAGVIALIRSKLYNWSFWTAPVAQCGGRRMFWPRGRVLGGSSAINAMVAIRGHASDYDRWAALGNAGWSYAEVLPLFKAVENYEPEDGVALTCDLRPLSRGEVRLASADPLVPPAIQPNYLAHERDLDKLVIAVKKAREILAQPAFDAHRGEEMMPGAAVQTDAQLRDWIRAHAETVYHPVGTCKMGGDALAVVDARLRVHGLQGLRVADASIMPTLIGGNTNGTATVIGEKAARMILEEAQSASATLMAAA